MDLSGFRRLFEEAVRRALREAGLSNGSEPEVELHGTPNPPGHISLEKALELLWLGPDRFYRIVDVGAYSQRGDPPVLFVRISGHKPSRFAETFDPADLGPFKSVGPVLRPRSG